MLIVVLCVVASLIIYYAHWFNKWRNPTCNGILPPGSMGLPLIGETIQLMIPSYSLDLHPFMKKRIQRYGSIFRTSLAGNKVVISVDPDFNTYIIQQEGKSVELWYMEAIAKLFKLDGEISITTVGRTHKYMRSSFLSHVGAEKLKDKWLPLIEDLIEKTLKSWSSQDSVEIKYALAVMMFNFSAYYGFGYDAEKSTEPLGEKYAALMKGFMSFPLNIPGTAYNKCLKEHKKVIDMLKSIVKTRMNSPELYREDFLDQLIKDKETKSFLTEDFIAQLLFGLTLVNFESPKGALTLMVMLLADHPLVLEALTAEHEEILKKRTNANSSLTWDEYKSMTFTHQVIKETLRLGDLSPILRRSTKDIEVKGYTIPAGWTIMLVNGGMHFNPKIYKDPAKFNPWRWQEMDPDIASKNLRPFGGGIRQCAGADYTKLIFATFIHILVTKYRFTKIKGGDVSRTVLLSTGSGLHIKLSAKHG